MAGPGSQLTKQKYGLPPGEEHRARVIGKEK
jgi:hypothetical protein